MRNINRQPPCYWDSGVTIGLILPFSTLCPTVLFNLLTWRHIRTEKSLCSLWFLNYLSLHHKKGKWRDCLGISKLFWEKIITVVYPESVRYSIICNFLHSHDILEHKILSCNAFSVLISVNTLNELIYSVRMTWSSALAHLLCIFNLSKMYLVKKSYDLHRITVDLFPPWWIYCSNFLLAWGEFKHH